MEQKLQKGVMWFYYQKSLAGTFESGVHDDCVLNVRSSTAVQSQIRFLYGFDLE